MKPMFAKLWTAAALFSTLVLGGCQHSGLWGDDEFARYGQRVDKVTESAGDAKEWNRVVQTDHPYPRYAYDHRIPVDAERMTNAVRAYRSGPKQMREQGKEGETWTPPPGAGADGSAAAGSAPAGQ
jgi:hypothetical protein